MPQLSTCNLPLSTPPRARLYHSTASVWLSVDPLSDKYPSASPYVYCAGNPVRLVDPDGRTFYEVDGEKKHINDGRDNITVHNVSQRQFNRLERRFSNNEKRYNRLAERIMDRNGYSEYSSVKNNFTGTNQAVKLDGISITEHKPNSDFSAKISFSIGAQAGVKSNRIWGIAANISSVDLLWFEGGTNSPFKMKAIDESRETTYKMGATIGPVFYTYSKETYQNPQHCAGIGMPAYRLGIGYNTDKYHSISFSAAWYWESILNLIGNNYDKILWQYSCCRQEKGSSI